MATFLVNPFYIWLIIMLLCVLIELFMMDFFLICFSIAAGITALLFLIFPMNLFWQLGLFSLFSILSFIFVRPVAKKFIFSKSDKKKLGADAYIGECYKVVEEIDNIESKGKVKIGSEIWRARSLDNTNITRDAVVEVKEIQGSTLLVIEKL